MLWKLLAPDELRASTYIVRRTALLIWQVLTLLQSLQTCTRSELYLGLCLTSWAVTAIEPLVQVNIYGIITCLWTCRQPGNFGNRSGYLAISIHWSDTSIIPRPHASGSHLLLHTTSQLWTSGASSTRCHTRLMMCSIHIDESATCGNHCMTITSLCTFL
jgi:hypothetical protein